MSAASTRQKQRGLEQLSVCSVAKLVENPKSLGHSLMLVGPVNTPSQAYSPPGPFPSLPCVALHQTVRAFSTQPRFVLFYLYVPSPVREEGFARRFLHLHILACEDILYPKLCDYDTREDSRLARCRHQLSTEDRLRCLATHVRMMEPAAYITRTNLSTSRSLSVPPPEPLRSISSTVRPHHSALSDRQSGFDSKQTQESGVRMPSELYYSPPQWLTGFRSALRLLIVVLSAGVAGTLIHTLEIYRGNISLDLRKGELPMTWPAHTNLVPTLALFAVAAASLFASLAIIILNLRNPFKRPLRSRDAYRIIAGSFAITLWACALAIFNWIDQTSRASLGRYACMHRNVMSNGRLQYRAVCSEQVRMAYIPWCNLTG